MKKHRRFRLKAKKTTVDIPLIDFQSIIAEIRKTRDEEIDSPKTFIDLARATLVGMIHVDYDSEDREPEWILRIFGNSAERDAETVPEESGQ